MTRLRTGSLCAALLLTASTMSGCKPDPNLPTAEMKSAQEAIAQAERAGALRYAGDELKLAQTAFQQAAEAHSHGNDSISNLRAVEAATLAAKAATAASSGQAQRADAAIAQATGSARASDESMMETAPSKTIASETTPSESASTETAPTESAPPQQ